MTFLKDENEPRQQPALKALDVLDDQYEARFDRITRLAQRVLGTERAGVTLIDDHNQWFMSLQGPKIGDVERHNSFCAVAVETPSDPLIVEDARADARFSDNPLVTAEQGIRFYAGQPIKGPDGAPVGALCVTDPEPRSAESVDLQSLRDLAAMVEDEIAALELAITDPLTGLANRRGFELLAPQIHAVADRLDAPIAVLYIDVDNLKPLNDYCGHDAGDRALIETARLLQNELRESDVIARIGGDEFAALLTNSSEHDASAAIERIRAATKRRNEQTDEPFELQMSVGAALSRRGMSLASIVEEADAQMIAAKRERKLARAA
ncbi:MAG: sensor domain-containing diguanylate cyclase [Solirubrobacterales bacterium]